MTRRLPCEVRMGWVRMVLWKRFSSPEALSGPVRHLSGRGTRYVIFDRIRPRSVTLTHMDARQADLLRKIDPAELGHRLRAARVAKGMTQTDLAGADVSVG